MNERKKYSLISDADIKEGIEKGEFSEESIELVRDSFGRIVKHLRKQECEMVLPPSLIQINSQIIYQADLKPVIEALLKTKNIEMFDDLEEKYLILLDCLEYYKNLGGRLDELNSKSLEFSSVFESRVKKYIRNFNCDKISSDEIDQFVCMLDSYINVLFIYLMSTYWLHSEKCLTDTTMKKKLDGLEDNIRTVYEHLLVKPFFRRNKEASISLDNSLYAKYVLGEEGKYLNFIRKLIKHDSRFSSYEHFMEYLLSNHLVSRERYDDFMNRYEMEHVFNLKAEALHASDPKHLLVNKLFDVMEKIGTLQAIFSEIECLAKLSVDEIDLTSPRLKNKVGSLLSIRSE